MTRTTFLAAVPWFLAICLLGARSAPAQEPDASLDEAPVSEATEGCIFCHENLHPGIVADWRNSRHARTTMAVALGRDELERRVSADSVPEELLEVAVGCAECHSHDAGSHPDTVEHGDDQMHPVVTPRDCALCHPAEVEQYGHNLMAHAYDNLMANPLYADLISQIDGIDTWVGSRLAHGAPHAHAVDDSCLQCHGTEVKVLRTETRDTGLGEMEFPVLSGWPNQGVGRINPDGSRGACTACHTRHEFSIEMARKPYTCSQCHKGPDVPAFKVYEVSKHGNIFKARGEDWDYDAVPWRPGEHFGAPTCATCHVSLLADGSDTVIAERTHRMNDRLDVRLFGLPYAHPHPKDPRTHTIRNAAGQPLPTDLAGEPAADALIDAAEQATRRAAMQRVCRSCHSQNWVAGHFEILDRAIESTAESTRTATAILLDAWSAGVVTGPDDGGSLFDETLERLWVEHWLFYANSIRFAAAMGGADYGVYANGRFQMSKNLRDMETLLRLEGRKR